ncbi:unnamed protein product [Rhizoctonia solani]|uniref:DUF6535 domain-containing protein n=1 Tax=Rhizoctonia solani TaxID=456999 RepID=A0A8H3BGN5_9AGAM|nr:unnamed protein product [Rhizoctonia solani]
MELEPLNFSELQNPPNVGNASANRASPGNNPPLAPRGTAPTKVAMDPNSLNPHMRFAADALGQELQPQASIWTMYVEEASEQDNELSDVQNKNLDLMLLFAALFSAILTAFLIESTNMLQQDPLDTSAALLLFIAQSQRRMELGIPAQTLDNIDTTPFSPTLSSRFINGLWFTALALSLSAALVAMLAKEWLAAYLAKAARPAYDRALARQIRYDGLIAWRALPIISFLPTLLHLSLLFFSLGLVVYLWNLDTGIAIVVLAITGATLSFYIITLLLGALFEPCPFVTQLSKYIRTAFKLYIKNWAPRRIEVWAEIIVSHSSIKQTESQALSWLIKNSHDPAVVECAYQAVASHVGLNTEKGDEFSDPALTAARDLNVQSTPNNPTSQQPQPGTSDNIIFFACICARLSDAIRQGPKVGLVDHGLNTAIARYALALPELLRHIIKNVGVEMATQCIQYATEAKMCPDNGDPDPINMASAALKDIDAAFSQQRGPMSADVYALLSASHLELTDIVASTLRIHTPPPSRPRSRADVVSSDRLHANEVIGPSATVVSLLRPSRREDLVQSSRLALARSSSQLHYHLNSRAQINSIYLAHLLRAVSKVMTCKQLRAEVRRNMVTTGVDADADSENDRAELSLRLAETILKMLQDTQIPRIPEFYITANQILASVAPFYSRQKPANLTADYWDNLLQGDEVIDNPLLTIAVDALPQLGSQLTTDPDRIRVLRQILALSALPFSNNNCLPVTALGILYEQVKGNSFWLHLWSKGVLSHHQLVEQWIHQAYKLQFDYSVANPDAVVKMSRCSTIGIIGRILMTYSEELSTLWLNISWGTCLAPLLFLISSTPDQDEEVWAILSYLTDSSKPAFGNMVEFLRSSKGFSTLHTIRTFGDDQYRTLPAILALLYSRELQVSEDNVDAMLEEVAFIMDAYTSTPTPSLYAEELSNLTEGVFYYLEEAYHRGVALPWDHRYVAEIKTMLQTHVLNGSEVLLKRLEVIQGDGVHIDEER